MSTATDTATPEPTPTEEPTLTATATEMAYLGGRAGLAAPLMGPESAPPVAPLAQPVTTTHRVISYTYDSLYRLTGATYSTGEYYTYTYNPVGNRQSLTTHQDVVNYGYDAANRLTSVNGQAYTWDDNGNLLSDGVRSYTYDHANRLTQVVSGTLTTEFAYNGAGDRVAKTVDGVTTDYVLDPAAGLTQVLQETTGGQVTRYLYGADLLAQYDSGTWAYHVNDGLGSVRQLADPMGQVVASYSFDPFGVPLGESGGEPYGFTGEQWDASTGLVYLRARYYQPGVGRFISKDPFPGYAHIPQSLNRWVYVRNDPVGLVDPSGLQEPVPVPTPGSLVVPEGTPVPPGGPGATPTLPPGVPMPPSVQPVGTPCPCDPSHEEATQWLLNAMQQNANGPMAKLIRYFLYEYDIPGRVLPEGCIGGEVGGRVQGRIIAWDLWIQMVKTNAPWDFKNFAHYEASWGGEYIQMCCGQYQYEAVANIHFGYVGRAAGLGNYELKIGAGLAQYWDHLLKPILNDQPPNEGYVRRIRRGEVWLHTFYDEPEDQAGIQIGLDLYNQNVSLTPEAFCNVFNRWASQLKVPPGG